MLSICTQHYDMDDSDFSILKCIKDVGLYTVLYKTPKENTVPLCVAT